MTDWITATGTPEQSSSAIATPGNTGPRYEWGSGGMEITAGHGLKRTPGMEVSSAPAADATTGLVFSTEAGFPVPAGGPRPHDMVEIGGMKVKVAQAIRDGLIADPAKAAPSAPQNAPQAAQQVTPQAAREAAPEASPSAADAFTAEVLPRVSPATTDSLMADLADGQFSEKTLDYLMLEGGQSAEALEGVRDAYAAKVTAATGLDEAELQVLWNSNRASFNAAVGEMLKTGSTAAFQSLAAQADAASFTPLSTEAAMTAWQDADFPQALIDAGLEPIFEGGQMAINIPGKGIVPWTDAVRLGYVKVSRA